MKVTINPPKTPVTKGSKGVAAATLPNVCKMPGAPAPFVPTPLPNVGKSGDSPKGYSKSVAIEGQPVAIEGASFRSVGDAASKGTGGGLVSANTHGPTTFVGPGSLDVKIEGKSVQLLGDPMLNNCDAGGKAPNSATMVGVLQASGLAALFGDEVCPLCGEQHGDEGKLEESVDTQGDADALADAIDRAIERAKIERAQLVAQAEADALAEAQAKYEAKRQRLTKNLAAARTSGNANAVAALEGMLATLAPEPKQPRSIRSVEFATMTGVVRCKDGQVFAGTSSFQRTEIAAEIPAGWHTPVAEHSLLDATGAYPDRREEFRRFVDDAGRFEEIWRDMQVMNERFRDGDMAEPHYPPGRCAAQQMLLLTLEHGGRPMGLTERWHSAGASSATVSVYVREDPSSPPQLRAFGGKDAVPPCGSCQAILTMLMCPNERPPECEHRAPAAGVCRCT